MDKAIEFPGVGGWKEQSYKKLLDYANSLGEGLQVKGERQGIGFLTKPLQKSSY